VANDVASMIEGGVAHGHHPMADCLESDACDGSHSVWCHCAEYVSYSCLLSTTPSMMHIVVKNTISMAMCYWRHGCLRSGRAQSCAVLNADVMDTLPSRYFHKGDTLTTVKLTAHPHLQHNAAQSGICSETYHINSHTDSCPCCDLVRKSSRS